MCRYRSQFAFTWIGDFRLFPARRFPAPSSDATPTPPKSDWADSGQPERTLDVSFHTSITASDTRAKRHTAPDINAQGSTRSTFECDSRIRRYASVRIVSRYICASPSSYGWLKNKKYVEARRETKTRNFTYEYEKIHPYFDIGHDTVPSYDGYTDFDYICLYTNMYEKMTRESYLEYVGNGDTTDPGCFLLLN